MPELNTSSIPDLVFAFLFFIMMVTTIREVTPKVSFSNLPTATELTKLEEKSLVTFIYVGKPNKEYREMYGSNSAIQLNDQVTQNPTAVYSYLKQSQSKIKDERRNLMQVSLKADKDTKMNIISQIKEELRRADALNLSVTTKSRFSLRYYSLRREPSSAPPCVSGALFLFIPRAPIHSFPRVEEASSRGIFHGEGARFWSASYLRLRLAGSFSLQGHFHRLGSCGP